jgi:hypothetical protein
VAIKGDAVELVEVELTSKKLARYAHIHHLHGQRIATDDISRIVYFCTAEAARTVPQQADKFIFRENRGRLQTLPVFDGQGKWLESAANRWPEETEAGNTFTTE